MGFQVRAGGKGRRDGGMEGWRASRKVGGEGGRGCVLIGFFHSFILEYILGFLYIYI